MFQLIAIVLILAGKFFASKTYFMEKNCILFKKIINWFLVTDASPILKTESQSPKFGEECANSSSCAEITPNAICHHGTCLCTWGYRIFEGICRPKTSEDWPMKLGEVCRKNQDCRLYIVGSRCDKKSKTCLCRPMYERWNLDSTHQCWIKQATSSTTNNVTPTPNISSSVSTTATPTIYSSATYTTLKTGIYSAASNTSDDTTAFPPLNTTLPDTTAICNTTDVKIASKKKLFIIVFCLKKIIKKIFVLFQ